jgi:predicted DNA-binding protein (MmcQ/YjbR family)
MSASAAWAEECALWAGAGSMRRVYSRSGVYDAPAARRGSEDEMAKSNHAAAAKALREFGLSFPEVTEHFPWGERVLKVKGKIFVFLGHAQPDAFGVTVKLPESNAAALTLPFTSPTGYGLGKSGWVSATFLPKQDIPVPIIRAWIEESYRAVAPKKLLLKLSGAAPAAKAKPAKGRRTRSPRSGA